MRIFISRPVMTLSSVLMLLNSAMFWNVRAMPEAAASWVRMPRVALALVGDGAFLRPVEAVDDIQHGTLAGTVRADDGQDLTLADLKADAVERTNAAERQADVVDLEQHFADPSRRRVHAAVGHVAVAWAKVSAARIFRSARMTDVRPSSNATVASTGTDERSEYSAAIRAP